MLGVSVNITSARRPKYYVDVGCCCYWIAAAATTKLLRGIHRIPGGYMWGMCSGCGNTRLPPFISSVGLSLLLNWVYGLPVQFGLGWCDWIMQLIIILTIN